MSSKIKLIGVVSSENFPNTKQIKKYLESLYVDNLGHLCWRVITQGDNFNNQIIQDEAEKWKIFWEQQNDNKVLVTLAHELTIFWDGQCKKTYKLIKLALKEKKTITLYVCNKT